jgi:ABC-2 type transport system permease protein
MRYIKLYGYFLRFSFSKAMEFRVDFYFRILMDAMYYVFQFLFFSVIYLHTDLLAGWNQEQITIFIAGYIFIDALNMTVFANNCWWFPIYVNRGDLDYYLTKPVSTLFFMSLREFAANSFLNLLIAMGILTWAITSYSIAFPLWKIFGFFLLLLVGTFIYFLVHFTFLLSVFWTQSPRGFGDVFYAVAHTIERPDRIFKGAIRVLFTYVIPFSVMASYPARFLLEEFSWNVVFTIFGVAIVLFFVVLGIWKKGLRSYSSASS